MSTRPTRRSLIGSYRYGVIIKPNETVFSEAMNGSIDLYDGKHIIETQKFTSFDQLANTIIGFWESKLGSDLNVHRFANWLSEYFADIGIKNINFYQLIETVRDIGRGVALHSTGIEIREAKVIQQPLVSRKERVAETEIAVEVEEEQTDTYVSEQLLKPSELYEASEAVISTIPHVKEEIVEDKELPPDDTLLKPSEILKKRDTVVFKEEIHEVQSMAVTGDPVVTSATPKIVKEPPPTDKLLRPSEYLKLRETIEAVSGSTTRPSQIPEEKKTDVIRQKKTVSKRLAPPSESLLKPSEYLKQRGELQKEEVETLRKPSDLLKARDDTVLKPPVRIDPKEHKIPVPPSVKKKKVPEKSKRKKPSSKLKESGLPFEIEVLEGQEEEEIEVKTELKITDIMGIGDKTAMLLKDGGFNNLEKIINSTPEELSKVRGIGITTAKKLIYGAKSILQKNK